MAFPPVLPRAGVLAKARTSSSTAEEPVEDDADGGPGSTNYAVPEENRTIWKSFGCDTEAGRMLRSLYQNKGQYSGISYPTPAQQKWQPAAKERRACPQRAQVNVPRVTNRPSVASDARSGPSRWGPPPPPGKKPMQDIILETNNYEKEKPILPHGRDQAVTKETLQVQCEFGGGRMMPKGAMGNARMEKVPIVGGAQAHRRRLDAEATEEEDLEEEERGMTVEQRQMRQEKLQLIETLNGRLAEIDAEDPSIPVSSKLKTQRNKEALQLQNDINRALMDLSRLKELAG